MENSGAVRRSHHCVAGLATDAHRAPARDEISHRCARRKRAADYRTAVYEERLFRHAAQRAVPWLDLAGSLVPARFRSSSGVGARRANDRRCCPPAKRAAPYSRSARTASRADESARVSSLARPSALTCEAPFNSVRSGRLRSARIARRRTHTTAATGSHADDCFADPECNANRDARSERTLSGATACFTVSARASASRHIRRLGNRAAARPDDDVRASQLETAVQRPYRYLFGFQQQTFAGSGNR